MFRPLGVVIEGGSHSLTSENDVVVGVDPSADIVVTGTGTSRRHGMLRWGGEHWTYTDANSTNGTYRSGLRVSEVVVDDLVELRLGHPSEGALLTLQPDATQAAGEGPEGTVVVGGDHQAGEAAAPATDQLPPEQVTVTTSVGRFIVDQPGPGLIGRDPSATVRLNRDGVSARHAEVRLEDGAWMLVDVGSTHGTFERARVSNASRSTKPVSCGSATRRGARKSGSNREDPAHRDPNDPCS